MKIHMNFINYFSFCFTLILRVLFSLSFSCLCHWWFVVPILSLVTRTFLFIFITFRSTSSHFTRTPSDSTPYIPLCLRRKTTVTVTTKITVLSVCQTFRLVKTHLYSIRFSESFGGTRTLTTRTFCVLYPNLTPSPTPWRDGGRGGEDGVGEGKFRSVTPNTNRVLWTESSTLQAK